MTSYQAQNAVLIIAFNRPFHTKKVLDAVRLATPRKLYIAIDGPRDEYPDDVKSVDSVKKVFEWIDWDCQVSYKISDVNLGCCDGPLAAINWVFEKEEAAIILEDDCIPAPSFFQFCDEMLDRYSSDERIMMISGMNILQKKNIGWSRGNYSYHFARLGINNGWASWKRAWSLNDIDMKNWDDKTVKLLLEQYLDKSLYIDRSNGYDYVKSIQGKKSMWDYQWDFARISNSGLTIIPRCNLISNIGFDSNATHETSDKSPAANLPYGSIAFPLLHPEFVIPDVEFDNLYLKALQSYGFGRIYHTALYQFLLKLFHLVRDGKWH